MITERRGNAFRGRVTVQTDRGTARLAVAGEVSPDTARITLWPAGTLPGSELRDWDMGRESGHILEPNLMGGLGRAGNRVFTWSFSR